MFGISSFSAEAFSALPSSTSSNVYLASFTIDASSDVTASAIKYAFGSATIESTRA
jgi:hypothetical protein